MNLDEVRDRLEHHRGRSHRRQYPPTRRELISIIDDLLELVVVLIEEIDQEPPEPMRSLIVQVVIPETDKVQLHAIEENAEGEPIDRDQASIEWTTDRQDIITLEPGDDAFGVFAIPVGGGAAGDTTVTGTVTEPSVDNGDGTSTPGQVYVGTQVVTVSADETIASVEIVADTPVPK